MPLDANESGPARGLGSLRSHEEQEEFERKLALAERRSFLRTAASVFILVVIGATVLFFMVRQARQSAEMSLREAESSKEQVLRFNEQLEELKQSLSNSREAVQYVTQGMNFYHAENYRAAVGAYDKALNLDAQNPYILDLKGYSLFKMRDFGGAIAAAQEAVQIRPDYAWGHYDLARFYCASDNLTLATASIKSAIQIRPDLPESIKNDGEFQRLCAPIRREFGIQGEGTQRDKGRGDAISKTIDQIHTGKHQALPPSESRHASGSEPSGWSISNSTPYKIHVYLSGPVQRESVIPSGGSISFQMPPGTYEQAVQALEGRVIPFYGTQVLGANERLEEAFSVVRHQEPSQ